MEECTWKVPGVELVEVDLGDDRDLEDMGVSLAPKVVQHKLLVCGVETEAWR